MQYVSEVYDQRHENIRKKVITSLGLQISLADLKPKAGSSVEIYRMFLYFET